MVKIFWLTALTLIIISGRLTAQTVYYVDNTRGDDAGSGLSWADAKQTIQTAVDLAVAGDTVLVTNGVYSIGSRVTPGYSCANRLVITNSIVVKSVNGAALTIIEGAEASGGGNGPDAVRCVYMSAGVLDGFTLTNGHTMTAGYTGFDMSGGGISLIGGNGVASNCTITGNSAYDNGGGCCYGTLGKCQIIGNASSQRGGGSYYSTLADCTVVSNSATYYGGGCYHGALRRCVLHGNIAGYDGGGMLGASLANSLLYDNHASRHGGGSYYGTLHNCTVVDNVADGIADIAVFRPSTGWWYGLLSDSSIMRHKWGVPGDEPVQRQHWIRKML
jgi:hypothetical protein